MQSDDELSPVANEILSNKFEGDTMFEPKSELLHKNQPQPPKSLISPGLKITGGNIDIDAFFTEKT